MEITGKTRIDTVIYSKGSICNGKPIEDLTIEEKKELVNRLAEKGIRCIIEGFNDKDKEEYDLGMTQENKDLLLKDLCARLPYEVKVNEAIQGDFTLIGLTKERVFTTCEVEGCHNDFPIELIKPYLFPMSSMTEEQKCEFIDTCTFLRDSAFGWTERTFDWLNKNHFDYRDLIPKGLALDATGLNIY